MTDQPYCPPELAKSAFHCPHCSAYANQLWGVAYSTRNAFSEAVHGPRHKSENTFVGWCTHCNNETLWVNKLLVYPVASSAPPANLDLPEEIRLDYEEAASIVDRSPRGAAALLRLCIQKLCKHLGEKGENINEDIKELVHKGLNPSIQKSLDVVRVVGNKSVHPGTLDLRDNPEVATALFKLVNIITEAMITQPNMISSLYESLPETNKKAIEKRDSKTNG